MIDGIVDTLNNFAAKAELKTAQKVFATPSTHRPPNTCITPEAPQTPHKPTTS